MAALSPAWNMAVDEAILREAGAGRSVPTLRFYRWDPPTLSLGRFQQAWGHVDLEACRRRRIGLVRRPTGGRAVLHDHEVTYAVVLPEVVGLPASVTEAYRLLSQGLAEGLRILGVEPQFLRPLPRNAKAAAPVAGEQGAAAAGAEGRGAAQDLSALCFEAPSWYELAAEGKKLVGSAQLRRHGGVLQHGSLLLHLDRALAAELLGGGGRSEGVLQSAASLDEALGRPVSFEEAADALKQGFGRALGWQVTPAALTPREERLARWLAEHKYGSDGWNLDRVEPEEPPWFQEVGDHA
ncbi:octanoyltransferase [Limnochorda pilosa]|uniref:Octanoyltransferase n=2 Tax=Limnochorda pilosa TaxID=1555112 RepID=A0A0K2SQN4_LIMPI|nr:octanoyltransferase [Limnochorda pilosa]